MNYTRVTWSVDLNCSHRSGDAASVVTITLIVAISPLFFYLPLRYTSKEKIKTVLKRKHLEFYVLRSFLMTENHSYHILKTSSSAGFASLNHRLKLVGTFYLIVSLLCGDIYTI